MASKVASDRRRRGVVACRLNATCNSVAAFTSPDTQRRSASANLFSSVAAILISGPEVSRLRLKESLQKHYQERRLVKRKSAEPNEFFLWRMRDEVLIAVPACQSIEFLYAPSGYLNVATQIGPRHANCDLRRNGNGKFYACLGKARPVKPLSLQVGIEKRHRVVRGDETCMCSVGTEKGQIHSPQ
jgi:hypothetical protein